jgi:hypothetical protein
MRLGSLLFAIALAACSSSYGPAGPSWPKAHGRERDGGESLAPRAAARAIATVAGDDKPADRAAADKPAASASDTPTAAGADKPAASPLGSTTIEDVIMTEEIVIEIESESRTALPERQ